MEEIKICRICKKSSNEVKITKYFDKRRNKEYYNSTCIDCKIKYNKKMYNNNINYREKTKIKSIEYRNTEQGFKSQLLHDSKKNKKFDTYELDLNILNELQNNQNNKCKITGIELVWKPLNIYQASIDRIDSSKGYLKNNIQLVILPINRMKLNYNQKFFNMIINEIKNPKNNTEIINIIDMYKNNKEFRNKIKCIFSKINSRKYKVNITINDILDKLQKCSMKCELTNIDLALSGWNALSIDRIDSNKDYTLDNIQIIGWCLNCSKYIYNNNDFINLINKIKNEINN